MVGHDVHNQPHAALLQSKGKTGELFLGTNFGIEAGVIGDVVAVHAAGMSHQERGGIAVRDPQMVEIGTTADACSNVKRRLSCKR